MKHYEEICYTMFHVKLHTEKQKIGEIGENVAVKFLVKRGFNIIERNYRKKCGEIDIICSKGDKIYFVEVKSVSRETNAHEQDDYRPEDNMHPQKILRLGRAISVYLEEKQIECDWEVIGVMILLNSVDKTAKITLLDDFAW